MKFNVFFLAIRAKFKLILPGVSIAIFREIKYNYLINKEFEFNR